MEFLAYAFILVACGAALVTIVAILLIEREYAAHEREVDQAFEVPPGLFEPNFVTKDYYAYLCARRVSAERRND